jgi:probable rRNA maturation factor
MKSRVEVRVAVKPPFPMSGREYGRALGGLLEFFGYAGWGIELSVTDDPGIASLNRDFMMVAGPTNVLSFPEEGPAGEEPFLGSICLSADTVRRECFLYRQNPREHAIRLLAHAVLHLTGVKHGRAMEELTEQATGHLRQELAL